ncbi:hypothetical protein VaNZ11_010334 [Volvox africanus]|uniref:Ubiquitin-like domain-containing protein n=1 Tax=Volvox africanus TaxID=51714 RepID=A0ABQ5S9A6_9CHLO|nr:hypothetical protein VaNZ11_010334 [Volvox africanus]
MNHRGCLPMCPPRMLRQLTPSPRKCRGVAQSDIRSSHARRARQPEAFRQHQQLHTKVGLNAMRPSPLCLAGPQLVLIDFWSATTATTITNATNAITAITAITATATAATTDTYATTATAATTATKETDAKIADTASIDAEPPRPPPQPSSPPPLRKQQRFTIRIETGKTLYKIESRWLHVYVDT